MAARCTIQIKQRALTTGEAVAYFDGPSTEADVPDDVSLANTEASTSATLFTRYTGAGRTTTGSLNTQTSRRSSKNRRREERKRARGKKGSVYEEEYLVHSIGRLVERVDSTRDEVERLIKGCARRGMRERASAVERSMVEVGGLCQACVHEVFTGLADADTSIPIPPDAAPASDDRGAHAGADVVDSVAEAQRSRETREPVVKDFSRLALLGGVDR